MTNTTLNRTGTEHLSPEAAEPQTAERAAGQAAAPATPTWRDALPWEGKPSRGDKALLGLMLGIPAFYLATMPFRPFLIADAPVLLEFVVGSKAAIGAAAAYASVGQLPLWLVLVAGLVGMAKFDWVFWLAGRTWGERMLAGFTQTPRQQRWSRKLQAMPGWALALLVVVARFPGVPGALIWTLAGLNRMRLATFLVLDLIGCALIVGIVATAGYLSGEAGVGMIQLIDNYALYISLGLVFALAFWQGRKNRTRQS